MTIIFSPNLRDKKEVSVHPQNIFGFDNKYCFILQP